MKFWQQPKKFIKKALGDLKPSLNLSILKDQNNVLTDDPDQIKSIITNYFKEVLKERQFTMTSNWLKAYEPKNNIPDNTFLSTCLPIIQGELDSVLLNYLSTKCQATQQFLTKPGPIWVQ
jgi:hypothetical protein